MFANTAETEWYVLNVKTRNTKKIFDVLAKKRLEYYFPVLIEKKSINGGKSLSVDPLLSSYLFVQASKSQFELLKHISSFANLLYWLGKPAVVSNEEVTSIRQFLVEHSDIHLEKIKIKVNEEVKVTYGAFMQREGNVLQVSGNTKRVELPSLGYAMIAPVREMQSKKTIDNKLADILVKEIVK